tara:strand:- start:5425 stop:5571 length:147 start_codon:yes stop_codon:yes gene_type:complete
MRAKIISDLPQIKNIESADSWLQQANAPDAWARAYRPENQVEPLPALW